VENKKLEKKMELAVDNTEEGYEKTEVKEMLRKYSRMISYRIESGKVGEETMPNFNEMKEALSALFEFSTYWNLVKFDLHEVEGRVGDRVIGLVAWFEGLSDPWFFCGLPTIEFFKDSPYEHLVKHKIPFLKKVPTLYTNTLKAFPLGDHNKIAEYPVEKCRGYHSYVNKGIYTLFDDNCRDFNAGIEDIRDWEQHLIRTKAGDDYIKKEFGDKFYEEKLKPFKGNFPSWRKKIF